MKNVANKLHVVWMLVIYRIIISSATDPEKKLLEKNERGGRSWHHPALFGPQMLLQHQQSPQVASTSQPGDTSNQQTTSHHQQSDPNGGIRNFEDHDKNNVPAASEQDFMSRHFGYLNVHRFDPNFPYYDRQVFPRFPSPQAPRFGPGYRKDKYGHGYGYSCKQGDDCDEVRAANQVTIPHAGHQQNPMAPYPNPMAPYPNPMAPYPNPMAPYPNSMAPFGNHYLDLSAFSSVPSFPSVPSFGNYGEPYPPAPAHFNDPHSPLIQSMMQPPRYYHARYLHDQEEDKKQEKKPEVEKSDAKTN